MTGKRLTPEAIAEIEGVANDILENVKATKGSEFLLLVKLASNMIAINSALAVHDIDLTRPCCSTLGSILPIQFGTVEMVAMHLGLTPAQIAEACDMARMMDDQAQAILHRNVQGGA